MKLEMAIKSRLQAWMDEVGDNFTTAADRAGVSVAAIRRLALNQWTRVDRDTWESVARAYGKPAIELFYEEPAIAPVSPAEQK
jgi:hypothetical protein